MSRDKSKSLEWGRARRPEISNRVSAPEPREGSEGDIQVRQTGIGARLFAKLGGRWLSNVLYGSEIDDPDIVFPKAWYKEDVTDADATTIVQLPDYINYGNFLGFTFNISLGTNQHHGWAWDTPGSGSDNNRCEVYYQRALNAVYISQVGTSPQDSAFKLMVFFK